MLIIEFGKAALNLFIELCKSPREFETGVPLTCGLTRGKAIDKVLVIRERAYGTCQWTAFILGQVPKDPEGFDDEFFIDGRLYDEPKSTFDMINALDEFFNQSSMPEKYRADYKTGMRQQLEALLPKQVMHLDATPS